MSIGNILTLLDDLSGPQRIAFYAGVLLVSLSFFILLVQLIKKRIVQYKIKKLRKRKTISKRHRKSKKLAH